MCHMREKKATHEKEQVLREELRVKFWIHVTSRTIKNNHDSRPRDSVET